LLSDLIDRKKVRRALAWALYMLAVLLVQNMIFSRITVLGVRAMFLPAAVAACGMFEGGTAGAVFGLFMGFFADMSFPENTVLFTALFALLGFFAGFAADFFLNRKFWPYMAASLVALLVTALFQMLGPVIFSGAAAGPLLKTAGLQVLWSLPVSALIYPIARSMSLRLDGVSERKDRA